jgi:hypothetical protein
MERKAMTEIDGNLRIIRTAKVKAIKMRGVDVVAGAPKQVSEAWSVGHQASRLDVFPSSKHRRQSTARSKELRSDFGKDLIRILTGYGIGRPSGLRCRCPFRKFHPGFGIRIGGGKIV